MRQVSTLLLVAMLVPLVGCADQHKRVDPAPISPAVSPPEPMPQIPDIPPQPDRRREDIETAVKPPVRAAVPDEQKAALMYQARLDLLRLMLCSEESIVIDGQATDSDELLQIAKEHFSNLGYRVVEGPGCPGFNASGAELRSRAFERDVDLFVLLSAKAEQRDKFGNFYSFQARGRGKALQISDSELLTTTSTTTAGKRALDQETAARSALEQCGQELAGKLSDEILRKSDRGLLLRRIEVDGLDRAALVDYVRVELAKKPGVESVTLINWNQTTQKAIYWVRINAAHKENLAAYLENLKEVRVRVERLDKLGTDTRRKGLLEF